MRQLNSHWPMIPAASFFGVQEPAGIPKEMSDAEKAVVGERMRRDQTGFLRGLDSPYDLGTASAPVRQTTEKERLAAQQSQMGGKTRIFSPRF